MPPGHGKPAMDPAAKHLVAQLNAFGPQTPAALDKALASFSVGGRHHAGTTRPRSAQAVLLAAGVKLSSPPENSQTVCLPAEAELLAAMAAAGPAARDITVPSADRATRVFARRHALRLGIARLRTTPHGLCFCRVATTVQSVRRRVKQAGDAGIHIDTLLAGDDGAAHAEFLAMLKSHTAIYLTSNKRVYYKKW